MTLVDTSNLKVIEPLPGWFGRHFHSPSMTFGQSEVEMTIDGATQLVRPGVVGVVYPDQKHSVRALTDGRAIVVAHPPRLDFGSYAESPGAGAGTALSSRKPKRR